ncbi:unnamed protein product [Pieris macdunnoughi]|uniref:WD repeat-containing protein 35 n=1 Tax=Pieris macdunnoughi TaxID=345717 RepID=A0A821M270_9NEOP|nr:unnamed protein product [Pieris macdunnoughi]
MFIYMSKKIAIPKQSNVTCLSWNHSSGYIAVGGEDGMLKVLKLESGGGGNLSMNLSLEGHTGQVCVAVWNEIFQKLTTSDEHGVIIVWMLYKGSWYEEMINNRNKSTVSGMAWGSDGQKICIAYEDGAVIVGSVDGSRVWGKDIKGPGLKCVQWSPDNSTLLFALSNGELHLYDDQGNFIMPIASNNVSSGMEIVSMDWFSGKAPISRPVLAICFKSGLMLLMKTCTEEESVMVETNMKILQCCWNHNGTVLAVAGLTQEQANVVQFFSGYGEHVRTLRVPGGSMRSLSWEQHSLRLAIAVDSFIYFANVKPDHKYAFYGSTLAFVSGTETVTFWDTITHQSWINHIPNVIDMCGVHEYCIISTIDSLIILNQQGIQCDAKTVAIPMSYVSINSKAIAVASSKDTFLIWKFSTPTRPRITEQLYHADGSLVVQGESGFHDDTICCITCSDTHLLVGRDSGTVLLFSLVNFKKITQINMNTKPYKLGLNCNSSKFFVIDQPGNLYILETEMANNISMGQAVRKDAWGHFGLLITLDYLRWQRRPDCMVCHANAKKKYHNQTDGRDLAIALRKRLGHWFRVVELLKMSVTTTESQVKQAYSNIGDYYIDRQNWAGAIEYYTMSNNTEGLKKCYLALEDSAALAKLTSPRNIKVDVTGKQITSEEKVEINQKPSITRITQLKESGKMLQGATMAYQLANLEASKNRSPWRIKKLYVLAGHMYSQASIEGSKSRDAIRSYRAAQAQQWACLAISRARAVPFRSDIALRAAARLAAVLDDLHEAQHLQAWCTIAAIALQARAFELCSKAFIKLEAIEPNTFENLAIEIFTKCKPKDAKGNKIDCPNCHFAMLDWMVSCPGCNTEFPGCVVTGRTLIALNTVWTCSKCTSQVQQHELVLRHSCPTCHSPLT